MFMQDDGFSSGETQLTITADMQEKILRAESNDPPMTAGHRESRGCGWWVR